MTKAHTFHLFRLVVSTISVLTIAFFFAVTDSHAVVRRKISGTSSAPRVTTTGIGISARFRSDRRAIILSLSNLSQTNSVSYLFTYETNGKAEGSQGVIRPESGNFASRELLFGTCSTSVCTYHTGIRNARLEVTANLKSGRTVTKRFRIKV